METSRQFKYVSVKKPDQHQVDYQERWTSRIDAVITLQRRIEERCLRYLNLTSPFHWGTRLVADIITAITWLLVYRPL